MRGTRSPGTPVLSAGKRPSPSGPVVQPPAGGLVDLMGQATLAQRGMAHRLIAEHEMGELFKVIGFAPGDGFDALGFSAGDRSHTL